MALYSVWDWNRNSYRIYTTPTPVSVGDDPVPPKPTGISPIGANPDTDIKPLPTGAKFIGYEHFPRGEIRRVPTGLADLGDDAGVNTAWWRHPAVMFAAGAGAVIAYGWWKRRRRTRKNRRGSR